MSKEFQAELTEQCVEFSRNWLKRRLGVVYADVNIAADIWDYINDYIRIIDGVNLPVVNILNGAGEPPKVSDLLIYSEKFYGTGHVAVVIAVDTTNDYVEVCEQNYANQKLPSDHRRKMPLVKHHDLFWILDAYLIGWKSLP